MGWKYKLYIDEGKSRFLLPSDREGLAELFYNIENDISVFGAGVLVFMVIILYLFFREKRWVLLPVVCCFVSVLVMVGYLGLTDWRVTVISSNFISILLIVTMSLVIHLIVRYGELYTKNPEAGQRTLVRETVRHMTLPCFYTAITTIVAFSSLVVSEIRPVIDFGWIMTIGISVAFIFSFVMFPALLVLMKPKRSVSSNDATKSLTSAISLFTLNQRNKILIVSLMVVLFCAVGVSNLQVENRFIDYFKTDTEIYRGMSVIDKQLGGTTPLEIIIDADQDFMEAVKKIGSGENIEDPFGEDPFNENDETEEENYWFHGDTLDLVEKIHDYLEKLPEIGKVLSIATTVKVIKILNDGKMPDDYDLALIRKMLPKDMQDTFVHPYLSEDANQVRITMRIEETDPNLNRGDLIKKINKHLINEFEIGEERVNFTGMAVLYNNMLQSLFRSQILTLGMVVLAILAMLIVLFRQIYLSFLAIIPNVLSAGIVLAIMGWLHISLDMMTITIAAITIGIAVDYTIHYIYRFKEEFAQNRDYRAGVNRCHGTIGRAIYYTSITVTLGFSILTLSNFIPTIYFGLFTGLAMVVALVNNLTLLPALILFCKPLGPEFQK